MKKNTGVLGKIVSYSQRHKIISGIIILIVIVGGYFIYKKNTSASTATHYVLSTVKRGEVVASVNGIGQVLALNQSDITSKVTGEVLGVYVKTGQEVKKGTLLVQIDPGNTAYEFESAKIAYNDLITVDPDDLRKAENTFSQTQQSVEDSYVGAQSSVSSVVIDITNTVDDLSTLFGSGGYLRSTNIGLSAISKTYQKRSEDSWYVSKDDLKNFNKKYREKPEFLDNATIDQMLSDLSYVASNLSSAVKDASDAVSYLKTHEDVSDTSSSQAYSLVSTLTSDINSVVSQISSSKNSISNSKISLQDATSNLDTIKNGPKTTDIRSQELSLRQKQDALADYYIRAPFDGVVASVGVTKGGYINSGTKIVTVITKQKITEISLNEIDAAKIKDGEKASITFDAIPDLTVSGEVSDVDLVGTVTQGVVNYNIKIAFDASDERIKPGMTTSAVIVSDTRQGVLIIPTSAVKSNARGNYVEVMDSNTSSTTPAQVKIKVGLSGDDTTEIVSGLNEGDSFVSRTVAGTSATPATSQAPSLFGNVGGSNRSNTGTTRGASTGQFTR